MKRTKEDAEQTRRNLIRTGVHVFHEKSYAATRLADIARAAGVTRGAIYHHFGNKAELMKAVASEHLGMFDTIFEEGLEQKKNDVLEVIREVVRLILSKLKNDDYFRHFMHILIRSNLKTELPEVGEILSLNKSSGYRRIKELLTKAREARQIKESLDIEPYALFISSSIFGIMFMWLEHMDEWDVQAYADQFIEYILAPAMK